MNILRRIPVLAVLIPLGAFFLLVFDHRTIPVHDTLSRVMRIHTFLNHYAATGHFPLWLPALDWGVPSSLYFLQTLSPSLMLLAPLLRVFRHLSVIDLTYASLFLDNLVLLGGTFALAKLLFRRDATAIFVTLIIVGPVVEMENALFSFYIFFSLPLCMYFTLRGITEGRKDSVFVGYAVFFVTGAYCVYTSALQLACLLIFTALAFVSYRVPFVNFWRTPWRRADVLWLFAALTAMAVPLALLVSSTKVELGPSGAIDHSTPYQYFLSHDWKFDASQFSGLIGGEKFSKNLISYGGMFLFPFFILGVVFAPTRKMVPFVGITVFLFLLWAGKDSFVAPVMFRVPGFNLFTHLGLVTSVIKLFLAFLAGFGFERWLVGVRDGVKRSRLNDLTLVSIFILIVVRFFPVYAESPISVRGVLAEVIYFVGIGLLASSLRHLRMRKLAPIFLLALVAIDAFSFRAYMYNLRMSNVPEFVWNQFHARPLMYPRMRTVNYFDNATFEKISPFTYLGQTDAPGLRRCLATGEKCPSNVGIFVFGNVSNEFEPFVNLDPCYGLIESEMILPTTKRIMRAFSLLGGEPRLTKLPALSQPGFLNLAGCETDKFRWASTVNILGDDAAVLAAVTDAKYRGELTAAKDDVTNYLRAIGRNEAEVLAPGDFGATSAAGASVSVQDYAFDRMTLSLSPAPRAGRWLYLADGWDPKWRVKILGRVEPVLRANGGFRAFWVPANVSRIELFYDAPQISALIGALWLLGAVFSVAFLFWFARTLLRPAASAIGATASRPADIYRLSA